MSSRLLDTNIVSYWIKGHALFRKYRHHFHGHDLLISFQTQAELWDWSISAAWEEPKQQRFDSRMKTLTVLHSDDVICMEWARIQTLRRGQPISTNDAWIAATALAYHLELITHNSADFQGIPGLVLISESP